VVVADRSGIKEMGEVVGLGYGSKEAVAEQVD
jgi:hypothetical protein